jgi:Right handed beta helix region
MALTVALVVGGLIVATFAVLPAATDWTRSAPRSATSDRATECEGIRLEPGSDPQAQLQRQPEGASFCFSAGVYRLVRPLTPKDQQRLVGEPGAILSGARVVTKWTQVNRAWRAEGYLPAEPFDHGQCIDNYRGCRYAEAVFHDSRQLWRVDTLDDLAPGRFFQDYDSNTIWIADDPRERTVEVARTEAAVTGESEAVLINGFIIEKFANPAQRGAVHAMGPDWRIENNEVRLNHGHGVFSGSAGGQVIRNHLHHNGQLGLGGDRDGQLVTRNEIDHNNTAGFDILWEAGGMKWFDSSGLTVSDNYVHHNEGPGLWTDINNIDTTYERNNIRDNTSHGIHHEISYEAVIRNNRIIGNGGAEPRSGWGDAGIRIAASRNVEIYGNVLVNNINGIMLVQQQRTDSPSRHGPHELDTINVHHNDISMANNVTGMIDDTGDYSLYHRNIRFSNNTYRLPNEDGEFFAWAGDYVNQMTWTQEYGHDTRGVFLTS